MKVIDISMNNHYGKGTAANHPSWTKDYLLVHFRTPAIVVLEGSEISSPPNSIILFAPGTPHYYFANQDTFIDDHIIFTAEDDSLRTELTIPFNTIIKLPTIFVFSRWIGALYDEYINNWKHRDSSIDLLMKLILIKISEFMHEDAGSHGFLSYYEVLQRLRKDIYSNPDKNWTVKEMAKFCNISPSYLQNLYKQAYQTTCISDVINSKIQFSKGLLVKTNDTIKEIAAQCGYHNYEFFMRQFKKYNYCTPSEYREKNTAPRVLHN